MFYVDEFEIEPVGERKAGGGVEGGDAVQKQRGRVEEFVAVNEVFAGKRGGKDSPTLAKNGGEVFLDGKTVEDATEGKCSGSFQLPRERENARAVGRV